MNGLVICGSSPQPLQPAIANDATDNNSLDSAGEWIKVDILQPQKEMISSQKESYKSVFLTNSIEIGFEDKDCMNDWIDAIMLQWESIFYS